MMHLCSRWKEVSDIKAKPLDVPIRAHNAVKWSPEGPENVFSITSLLAALGLYNYFLPKLKKKKKISLWNWIVYFSILMLQINIQFSEASKFQRLFDRH